MVVLTWDPACRAQFWLTRDYFPSIEQRDAARFPALSAFEALGPAEVRRLPIPWDCVDGFLGAYWRRPEAYLSEVVRSSMSGFAQLTGQELQDGLSELKRDLASGAWHRRYRELLGEHTADLGYRLVVVELA